MTVLTGQIKVQEAHKSMQEKKSIQHLEQRRRMEIKLEDFS